VVKLGEHVEKKKASPGANWGGEGLRRSLMEGQESTGKGLGDSRRGTSRTRGGKFGGGRKKGGVYHGGGTFRGAAPKIMKKGGGRDSRRGEVNHREGVSKRGA